MSSDPTWTVTLPSGTAHARFTLRDDGDFRVTAPPEHLAQRRSGVVDLPWVGLTQVHGAAVAVVDGPEPGPVEADALVTAEQHLVLSVNVADCAPVALVSREGVVGAVHAGWAGTEAGVLEAAVDAMRSRGARHISAWLGPCIHPECYEFGAADLDRLVERFGPAVRSRTAAGTPALDLPMAVAAALGRSGVPLVGEAGACTACDGVRYFSHRARRDAGRHALAVWTSPPDEDA